jgi:hypothetical protein
MTRMESSPGERITHACEKALAEAIRTNDLVSFTFNDTEVVAQPTDTVEALEARWNKDRDEAYKKLIESPEYKAKEAKRAADLAAAMVASMKNAATTEKEMREADVPWPYTLAQLDEYINSLVEREHDYGTCVYAMSMAAMAAFYYVSRKLGVTGFQASCADLDILRRSRHLDGPFIILKGEDMLYPQYDLPEKLREAMGEWQGWIAEEAKKKLAEHPDGNVHPNVLAHWKRLAS